ncbi:hypothetical protein L226DRAFT_467307 [Lentinus tigrinus ALCF2SS1-7]|uniref:Uncharacterized protein n=1 Tax=Lentinus tigrinus ALCF2SS1-6 TaxID=1328759 RepID=A0A5C2S3F0_9APHY|nr:hypothetical protein L227DRAFT_505712 [Lentinus tigrinus ALCF2SS1-6]RPD72292.1 hypothetical protein L226DRAFT_467307 [Lentinus tigrinus ALCF2SS1-7]
MLLSWPGGRIFTLFSCTFFATLVNAALVNVTIDDTFGNTQENLQIIYQPPGAWSPGQSCTNCEAHLDATQIYNGTWHDTTYLSDNPPSSPLSASLTFDGVAIYVYCIVTQSSTDPFGNSDMTFYLDGVEVGNFTLPPDGDSTYHYNFPVYVNESIPSGKHSFMLVNGRAGGQTALALLDSIVFS